MTADIAGVAREREFWKGLAILLLRKLGGKTTVTSAEQFAALFEDRLVVSEHYFIEDADVIYFATEEQLNAKTAHLQSSTNFADSNDENQPEKTTR